jgi:dienelactone hydrolase
VTGPDNADTAILVVYDIFGYFPQILQGADILAHSDKEHPMQVFMPDFFQEHGCADIAWYPPDTDEKGKKLGKWFEGAAPPKHLPKIAGLVAAAEKANPNIKSWGMIGYCWGGKMVSLIAGKEGPKFKAAVQTSPAMVDPEEAKKVRIPMCIFPSQDEPKDEWEQYKNNLTVDHHFERFDSVPHGFMSARADLKDAEHKKQYEHGYQTALEFFNKHL